MDRHLTNACVPIGNIYLENIYILQRSLVSLVLFSFSFDVKSHSIKNRSWADGRP